jgi:hypothetical protein
MPDGIHNLTVPPESRMRKLGHVALAALIFLLLPLVVPLALLFFLGNRLMLNVLVLLCWVPKGKDILFVYPDSPIWLEYMTSQVLPLVKHRAAVLNWSERSRWSPWSLAVRLFRTYAGGRDYNPMVVLFRPLRSARCFRFLPAFQEWKHGNQAPLERLRQDLIRALQQTP